MKLKLKITKEILIRSRLCTSSDVVDNCAFALAFKEIVPFTQVGSGTTTFLDKTGDTIGRYNHKQDQSIFINNFDSNTSEGRMLMPEQEFEVEIPDNVIEYYYQDYAVLAQKIADSKIFQPA